MIKILMNLNDQIQEENKKEIVKNNFIENHKSKLKRYFFLKSNSMIA